MNVKDGFKNKCKQGFTLLEMTIVLIIITILTSAAIPSLTQNFLNKAEQKVSMDINAIEDGALAYYVKNSSWPTSITPSGANPPTDLESNGYLPSGWNAINPFGNAYTSSLSGQVFTVSTQVPNGTQTSIIYQLPASLSVGNVVSSSVAPPGSPGGLPTGTILAWAGTTAPAGFLLCDGTVYSTSSYPDLGPLLGATFGGNGSTTFAVPDLRGRSIVGLNTLAVNDGTDRIWSTDNYSNNLGQAASYNVNEIGGVFGEEKHRQTVVELAPHTHPFASWDYVKGFSGNSTTSPRDPQGGTTGSAGGNGDGTGLGAAANVVEPSMALNYIVKY